MAEEEGMEGKKNKGEGAEEEEEVEVEAARMRLGDKSSRVIFSLFARLLLSAATRPLKACPERRGPPPPPHLHLHLLQLYELRPA